MRTISDLRWKQCTRRNPGGHDIPSAINSPPTGSGTIFTQGSTPRGHECSSTGGYLPKACRMARSQDSSAGTARRREDGLIRLTSNEIRRLFAFLVLTVHHGYRHVLALSTFRRQRQDQARGTHYRKRLERLKSNHPP